MLASKGTFASSDRLISPQMRELGLNTTAATIAGGIQISMANPIDCLRVRLQVANPAPTGGLARFATEIVKRQGYVAALHAPGLLWNVAAVATSQGLRMGLYPTARDMVNSITPGDSKPAGMVVASFGTGALAYAVANPLYLIKVRAQATSQHIYEGRAPLTYTYNSVPKLWAGLTPLVLRGASMTVGHLTGYDLTKSVLRDNHILEDGPGLVCLSAVAGGVGASTTSAPADVIMSRHMAAGGTKTIRTCCKELYSEAGVRGFARGWSANVIRYVPTFLVGSSIYEAVRVQLGLGYL